MMNAIFSSASKESRDLYERYLRTISALSYLFSNSSRPYLDYRIAENLFCRCFNAENLSRSCIAVDARIGTRGIGIKTFVDNGPFQKIAEFDKLKNEVNSGDPMEDAYRVSELRNKRLDLARDAYDIEVFSYHYVLRGDHEISIHECPMDYIDTDKIRLGRSTDKGFDFKDGLNSYKFSRAKSTLFESFPLDRPLYAFGVEFIEDPIESLVKIIDLNEIESPADSEEYIVLPLYSKRGGKNVPVKSGLNQWNADGRRRNFDEVYISYPKYAQALSPGFFPGRDTSFELELPDKKIISAKLCQDGDKAIMSNPNSALGEWILRKVLKLNRGELATIDMLEERGINAVRFTKHSPTNFSVDFDYIGEKDDEKEN